MKKTGSEDGDIIFLAREGIAYCHEARGSFDKALEMYKKLNESSLPYVRSWALMGMARCHEKLGDMGKALEDYRLLTSEHPQHPRAAEIKANIARIEQLSGPKAEETLENKQEP